MGDTKIVIKKNRLKYKDVKKVSDRTKKGALGMILGALVPVGLQLLGIEIPAELAGGIAEVLTTIIGGVAGSWLGNPDDPRDLDGVEVVED